MTEDKTYEILCENVRALMSTPSGTQVIWHILDFCGLYTYIPESSGVALGRREVGLDILSLLEDSDSSLYPNLLLTYQESEKDYGKESNS